MSSSGHLVLFQRVFKITEPAVTFDVVLHLGTLVPVFIIYFHRIADLIKRPFQKMTYLLIVATIPAVIFGVLFDDVIEKLFEGGIFMAIGFTVTGLLLFYADGVSNGTRREKHLTYVDALFIGLLQAIAITPSVSRSGSTICGALSRKLDKQTAARFSFLMSIPAILGAAVLQVKDIITAEPGEIVSQIGVMPMIFGFIAAMLSGYLAIRFMLKLITETKLKYCSYYLFLLAAFIALDCNVTHFFF